VTGYLIGDEETIEKRKGKKMEGLGLHHWTTQDECVRGTSSGRESVCAVGTTLSLGSPAVSKACRL
jgi:hypothetical protein